MTELTTMQIAARRHRAADMLTFQTYGETNGHFIGCSVGCFAYDIAPEKFDGDWDNSLNLHRLVAEAGGYPEWLVRLQDTVFEGLPASEALDWHVDLQDAIVARKRDWQIILHAVHAVILRVSWRTAGSAQEVVQGVMDLHERAVHGELVVENDWSAAESAAWSATSSAESAAWSAAESAARSAAWSAVWSARSAAASAESAAWSATSSAVWSARSAARSAAWSAAESAAYQEIRDGVLAELVRE